MRSLLKAAAFWPSDQVLVPPGERELDFPGCTLMPGLVDAHTHISFNMGDQPVDALEPGWTPSAWRCREPAICGWDLEAGVTLIRVAGEADFVDVAVGAVAAGTVPGSGRPVTATRGLAATNGHGGAMARQCRRWRRRNASGESRTISAGALI